MNRLDTKPQDTSFAIAPSDSTVHFNPSPEAARRLIVLIPADANYSTATRRIWELANATGASVQFLGLCKDAEQEPRLHRELITISALMRDGRISADAKVEIGTDWVGAVKRNYHAGDMIVCFAESRAGLWHKPLHQILKSNFGGTVYILSNLTPQSPASSNWLSQSMAWIGSIGIMVLFFFLQIRIGATPQDWEQTLLLILSVLGEIWFIWGWNNLFS